MPLTEKPLPAGFSERYYSQVNESINSLIELTTRVDERVINMIRKQELTDEKISTQLDVINNLNTKVRLLETFNEDNSETSTSMHKLELRLQMLENSSNNQENRWKTIFGFSIQLVWVILAAFLLFKLGIQAPAVP